MSASPPERARFPAPDGAVCLYQGTVMHARLKPVAHRFRYGVFSILVDLRRLEEASRASPLFSVNRFNLVSFYEKDHGAVDRREGASALIDEVARLLQPVGVAIEGARVLLLCYPRILGFVFNPLSVYFVYGAGGDLLALIYEVRNTFGERHSYVAPVEPGELSVAGLRQERAKRFYVSPFNPLELRYGFRILPPGERVALRIIARDQGGALLAAAFAGKRADLTTSALVAALRKVPLLTVKVVGGIHLEALKLWRKGLRFYRRPVAPEPVSYNER